MYEANDERLYRIVIGEKPELAAVHKMTGSLEDVVGVRNSETPHTMWLKYYRPPLERDGFTSETDYETIHFAETETLDNFVVVNRTSQPIHPSSGLTLVDTDQFQSRQDACSSIERCTGWWRFTRIGYNKEYSQALLHTDYDNPKYGLMGMGHFVLLERNKDQWKVLAKHMTWIS